MYLPGHSPQVSIRTVASSISSCSSRLCTKSSVHWMTPKHMASTSALNIKPSSLSSTQESSYSTTMTPTTVLFYSNSMVLPTTTLFTPMFQNSLLHTRGSSTCVLIPSLAFTRFWMPEILLVVDRLRAQQMRYSRSSQVKVHLFLMINQITPNLLMCC